MGQLIEWSFVSKVELKAGKISIWTNGTKHSGWMRVSDVFSLAEFLRAHTTVSVKILKMRWSVFAIVLVLIPISVILALLPFLPFLFLGYALLAVAIGLLAFFVRRPEEVQLD